MSRRIIAGAVGLDRADVFHMQEEKTGHEGKALKHCRSLRPYGKYVIL